MQLRTCVMKIVYIQGRSPNRASDLPYYKELLFNEEFAPSGSKFFPLIEVPILKRDEIEENHCLFQ